MSRWSEQLDSHPIWKTIERISSLIEVEHENTGDDYFTEKRRITRIVTLLETTLKSIDADVTPFDILDSLNTHLTNNVLNQVQAFSTSGATNQLQAANEHLSSLLKQIAYLRSLSITPSLADDKARLDDLTDQFVRAISEKERGLSQSLDQAKVRLTELENSQNSLGSSIEQKKQETDTLISTWQDQFSQAQNQRNSDYNQIKDQISKDAETKIGAVVETNENELKKILAMFDKQINFNREKADLLVETILDDIKSKHEQILALYEIVAVDSATAGYTKDANNEQTAANLWRIFSIVFLIATAAWLFSTVIYINFFAGGSIEWNAYPTIISLTGVLLLGAGYAAQQSSRHRTNERRNRWLALRVAAFEPFVSPLSQEEKNELRKEISKVLFTDDHGDEHVDREQTVTINAIVDAMVKIAKAFNK